MLVFTVVFYQAPGYTRQAESELIDELTQHLPEVILDEIECGKRFCRAVLSGEKLKGPELAPLLGTPPIESDGFANVQDDGRLAFSFHARESVWRISARKHVLHKITDQCKRNWIGFCPAVQALGAVWSAPDPSCACGGCSLS